MTDRQHRNQIFIRADTRRFGTMWNFATTTREISPGACKQRIAQAAAKEREKVQPFIDLARVLATKCDEMQDLMRRNKIVIDNVQEPMQKLAFTFYSEIAELAHKAEVVIEEYEESLREGAGKPDKGR